MPNKVLSVRKYAFKRCYYLTYICFGESIRAFQTEAFYQSGLKTIIFHSKTPPSIESRVFYDYKSIESIYVPENSVETFKTSGFTSGNLLVDKIKPNTLYKNHFFDLNGLKTLWLKIKNKFPTSASKNYLKITEKDNIKSFSIEDNRIIQGSTNNVYKLLSTNGYIDNIINENFGKSLSNDEISTIFDEITTKEYIDISPDAMFGYDTGIIVNDDKWEFEIKALLTNDGKNSSGKYSGNTIAHTKYCFFTNGALLTTEEMKIIPCTFISESVMLFLMGVGGGYNNLEGDEGTLNIGSSTQINGHYYLSSNRFYHYTSSNKIVEGNPPENINSLYTNNNTIRLFASNYARNAGSKNNFISFFFYYFKAWHDGELVCNVIPQANSKYYRLYDTIQNRIIGDGFFE